MVGKYNLERLTRIPVEVALASEFRYMRSHRGRTSTLVIVISQSGETLDTMAALREAKQLGARILSIVNVVGSSIARESDDVLYTWAGPGDRRGHHQGLLHPAGGDGPAGPVLCADLLGTIDAGGRYRTISAGAAAAAGQDASRSSAARRRTSSITPASTSTTTRCFSSAANVDYALGLEGSLKLKEISYIHSEAYASGELKHGTISLIEDGTLVVALGTYGRLFEKAMSNVVEVKSPGGGRAGPDHRGACRGDGQDGRRP